MSPLENQCTQNLERFVKIWMKNFSFRDFSFTKTKNLCVSLLQGFIILIADIRTIAPPPPPPPRKIVPSVRVGVLAKVMVSFRVGGQPDNCPGENLTPG